jgi:hypothetical protein
MVTGFRRCIPFAAILLVATAVSAHAGDEIQVYNADIAKVGQWTFQLHNNYAFIGRKEPDCSCCSTAPVSWHRASVASASAPAFSS